LASRGETIFNRSCADCHGTYGDQAHYPNRRVAIEDVGTDRVRLDALTPEGRQKYADSWFAHAGQADAQQTVVEPDGYVAPPLDGVWASAPYFHNGSVPTLWHLLNPSERPAVWRRSSLAMDHELVGLSVVEEDRVSLVESDVAIRRSYFDTKRFGKGNGGHDYPDALTSAEKAAVLEYLKTL
jgi:hypothetical protein